MQGGDNIEVSGSGTLNDPYVVDASGAVDISSAVQFVDSDTVDFTVTGAGTTANPYQVEADASLALDDLTDTDASTPADNDVLTWDGDSWVPAPVSVEPGTVITDSSIPGDGSASDPFAINVFSDETIVGTGTEDDPLSVDIAVEGPLAGTGTDADPLRVDIDLIKSASGTANTPSTEGGAHGTVTVTYPVNRFTQTPAVVATSRTTVPSIRGLIGVTGAGFTSFDCTIFNGGAGALEDGVGFYWVATQSKEVPVQFALDGPSEDLARGVVTCPTEGCPNQGFPIEIPIERYNEETEVVEPWSGHVQCGVCRTDISSTMVPVSS